jgi:hypothetical protein
LNREMPWIDFTDMDSYCQLFWSHLLLQITFFFSLHLTLKKKLLSSPAWM